MKQFSLVGKSLAVNRIMEIRVFIMISISGANDVHLSLGSKELESLPSYHILDSSPKSTVHKLLLSSLTPPCLNPSISFGPHNQIFFQNHRT